MSMKTEMEIMKRFIQIEEKLEDLKLMIEHTQKVIQNHMKKPSHDKEKKDN